MLNIIFFLFGTAFSYQAQVPQSDQSSQQNHQQDTNSAHYVPQEGSFGSAPSPLPRPMPRLIPNRRPVYPIIKPTRRPAHITEHNHNTDYRWEISGCYKPMIQAQLGFRQFLVSDSFPNINPAAINCIWRFKAPTGMLIKVTWRNFHLDNCNKGSSLRIFDGFDPENTPFPKTHCGLKKPEIYVTSGRFMTMILNSLATGSPLGVQLMVGFEAIVDPKGLEMPNTMMMFPNSPISFDGDALDQSSGSVARTHSGTGGKGLVQVGKYSFKSTEDEIVVEDTSDGESETETEKQSIAKPSIGLYIGGIIGVLIFVGVIAQVARRKTSNKNDDEEEKKEQPGVQ